MTYAESLKQAQDEAEPATGLSRAEVERRLNIITDELKGSISNVERISLCAARASYRKALADLS